jgi:large subunit ribosomal protein L31
MVYEKQEKHHNILNVNIIHFQNMPKTDIHPNWFNNAIVYCDGKPLCTIGSTKKELQVDIWLLNHPFYNTTSTIIDSEGRVERFMKKYGLNLTD